MVTEAERKAFVQENEEVAKIGEEIYAKLDFESRKQNIGLFVVINIATGAYVLGKDENEALDRGRSEFGRQFRAYIRRIGMPTVSVGIGQYLL